MSTKPSGAKLTEMQEKTSAWIFDQALNHNHKFKSSLDIIRNDDFKNEIIGTTTKPGIYPWVDRLWIDSFYKQQQKFLDEFSNSKFKEFSVSGGFMDFVSKLVNKKYGVIKKDAWDPADVWCIQNENSVVKQIKDAIEKSDDIEKLNAILRTLFKERKVVGISLKLVDKRKPSARYQEVNVTEGVMFTSGKHPTFTVPLRYTRCDLLMRENGVFKNAGSSIIFIVNYTKEKVKYTLTLRTSGRTYKPGNLNFEFQEPGGSAQIGKAPVELVYKAGKKYKINFINDWHKYPTSVVEFNTERNKYEKMYNKIHNKIQTDINDYDEFEEYMLELLADKQNVGTANSKLMQVSFLYELVLLSQKDLEGFITDLFFLAEKRGKGFGPFGKLY